MPVQVALKYNIVTDDGEPSSVTIFPGDGPPKVATKENPNFAAIIRGITETGKTEEEIIGLFDTAVALTTKFSKVSDRVSIRGGKVFFDNMPTENVLTDAIIRFYLAGHDDFMSLVNFMEKIEVNPNPNSRENLFRWLSSGRFSITPDGDIIAYKSVNRRTGLGVVKAGDPPDEYLSTRSGPAIVDGNPVNGHVPNNPGVIVEMARDEVTFDPHTTCSKGLHVADWSYASPSGPMDGNAILMVLVNPRDVVSVPTDYGNKKMRVCRYKVLQRVTREETDMLHVNAELQTLTARMVEWSPPKAALVKSTTPKKAAPKKAATVKKAAAKKPFAEPVKSGLKKAPAKKAAPGKPTKKVAEKKPATIQKSVKLPKYYEEFTVEHFVTLPFVKLQWLAKQWEIKTTGLRTAAALSRALADAAQVRLAKAGRKTSSK